MKKHIMIFAALAAMFSCNNVDKIYEPQTPEITITAVHTKTVIGNDASIYWDGEEEIAALFTKGAGEFHVEKFENSNEAGKTARFVGRIDSGVHTSKGWDDVVYCIYPSTSVNKSTGAIVHTLPAEQYAHVNGSGSFESGLNISYSTFPLSELEKNLQGNVFFRNSLSVLRMTPGSDDITSITINGSAPLAGSAPMVFDGESLVVDTEVEWIGSTTVVLKPSSGSECFKAGTTYNILVYPGKHDTFSVTLNYKEYGGYTKSLKTAPTLAPSKHYTIGFTSDSEVIITELGNDVADLENRLPSLGDLEGNVTALLSQIQSVSLMTEYLDNSVYAHYAQMTYSKQKLDLSLDYIIKPESAAVALVEAFSQNPAVVSGVLGYRKGAGLEMQAETLGVKTLNIKSVSGVNVVTATFDATDIHNNFYDGTWGASVALQIASGKTDMISEFANLVPKSGSVITGSTLIPAISDTRIVVPFSYAVSDPEASYNVAVTGYENVQGASLNYDENSRTGNLTVAFSDGAIHSPSVTVTLTVGEGEDQERVSHTFTFVDSGSEIDLVDPGMVDYIGGEIVLNVNVQNVQNYSLTCSGNGVSQSGNIFAFGQNDGGERTATIECQATIPGVSYNYYKSITITQKAYGTSLSRTYYTDGQKVVLNQANASGCSNYFNIVILGDGYQKKDLHVGGKFERSARSAMDSFFAIEPYKTFMNRFNVYMVAYESTDEGTDIKSSSIEKNTYFGSYCQGGGNTAAYVASEQTVINAVKTAVGSGDATYYRSIAILLINTDEQAGSTGYPFRDPKDGWPNGYASFSIAALAANSTGTNGLIKHEAGGHAFGRLADEYYTNGATASSVNKTDLSNWHAKGWYWNVSSSNTGNYYKFTNSDYSSEVSFIQGAWGYQYGIYRPTQGGMMQGNTGVFNAPSRHAIYHRIITESQGTGAYSWSNFISYDQKNR